MKIVVAGGTGFIGESLVGRLLARGDEVAVLTRDAARVRMGTPLQWSPPTQGPWTDEVALADAVVNLAGENIGEGRWTSQRKRRILTSRVDATGAIVDALRAGGAKPRVLVNASAVGIYGDRGDEVLDESSIRGPGFLGDVVEQWEAAARKAEPVARLVLLRFGVVLAGDGGALPRMMLPFRFGAGGPIGSGKQWMAWITRNDVVRVIEWAIDNREARGIYNATAEPVRNRDFAKALGHAMRRPALIPTPAFAMRLAFGQMGEELLLGGQRAVSRRLEAEGFTFESRTIDEALRAALGGKR